MRCDKCGGPLYADRQSIAELARRGVHGGRVYCLAGCTSIWLREPTTPVPFVHDYYREQRSFVCRICGQRDLTYGNNAKWCQRCRESRRKARARAPARVVA